MLQNGLKECLKSQVSSPATVSCILSCTVDNEFNVIRKGYDRTEQELNSYNKKPIKCNLMFTHINNHTKHSFEYLEACLSSFPLSCRGSLAIEAAIVLPLFLFMMFILIFPLRVMEEERRLQNTIENVGKQLAAAEYIKTVGNELLKSDGGDNETFKSFVNGAEEGVALGVILAKALETKSISMPYFSEETGIFSGENEDMFKVELKYDIKLPFSAYFISAPTGSIVANRRAWTGSDGGRGRSKYSTDGEDDTEERIVYLGKTSTVYHDNPNCHYLSNVTRTADAAHMEALRNENGAKYHACPSCKPGSSGTVYYFESGTAYHSSEQCKAITAYSRAVKLSEVGDMRACSYCGNCSAPHRHIA